MGSTIVSASGGSSEYQFEGGFPQAESVRRARDDGDFDLSTSPSASRRRRRDRHRARQYRSSYSPAQVPTVPLPTSRPVRAATALRPEDDVNAPLTRPVVAQWLQTWMRMCNDSGLVSLTDEERARTVYDLSGRQLRSIRSAALSGSLAWRAAELGVDLPDGFAETVAERANGHDLESSAA